MLRLDETNEQILRECFGPRVGPKWVASPEAGAHVHRRAHTKCSIFPLGP